MRQRPSTLGSAEPETTAFKECVLHRSPQQGRATAPAGPEPVRVALGKEPGSLQAPERRLDPSTQAAGEPGPGAAVPGPPSAVNKGSLWPKSLKMDQILESSAFLQLSAAFGFESAMEFILLH
ncbi:hypothetical protein H920_03776 [Fukomys damarensis]|uniref:Uncharacterized protein n=1 Tax=Fukomys damarensis TaxID=885580 RepID=A0A091DWE8_FUKDA|nr:hypothetical protein H920_03776 [Fukomys damarensis]